MKFIQIVLAFVAVAVVGNAAAQAPRPDDRVALGGATAAKVVWDINADQAEKLSLYLDVIQETYEDLMRQNARPEMVLAFRGASVKLLTAEAAAKTPALATVARQVDELSKLPGVTLEVCSVATRLFGVDNATLLAGGKPVGNTFVSLIGYQARGYAVIPIY